MYPSILNIFPVIRTASAKNRRFHVTQPTFLFPLETPLRLSRNMFHGWKDNSMLAKPLAACTYLSSIVSELYDACQTPRSMYLSIFNSFRVIRECVSPKTAIFTTFLFPLHGEAPGAITLNVVWMEREFDAYKLSRSMYPSIFNSFPVIRTAIAKNRPFSRTAAHIFVSPGDAPGAITLNVVWMEENSMLKNCLAACTHLS